MSERHQIKVLCNAHPGGRVTFVDRVWVVPRLPDCEAVAREYRYTRPDASAECRDFIIMDRQRPSELCEKCAGSGWRLATTGTELLRGMEYVGGPRAVSGGRLEPPNEELHRVVRYRFRFTCPRCGPRGSDVELTHAVADAVFSRLAEQGKRRVMLSTLATMTM